MGGVIMIIHSWKFIKLLILCCFYFIWSVPLLCWCHACQSMFLEWWLIGWYVGIISGDGIGVVVSVDAVIGFNSRFNMLSSTWFSIWLKNIAWVVKCQYVLCVVHCVLCIVCCALCIVCCALCVVHCALCIVHCALCIVHCALCIARVVFLCTMCYVLLFVKLYGQCSINMVSNYYWWIVNKPNTYVKAAETPGGGEYIYNEIEAIS